MKIQAILAAAIVSIMASSASSKAATITYDSTFSGLDITADAHSSGLTVLGTFSDTGLESIDILLPMFDLSLGTLESAQFNIDLTTNTTDASFEVATLTITVSAITLDRELSFSVSGISGDLDSGTANLSGSALAALLGITLGSATGTDGTLTNNTAVGDLSSGVLTSASSLSAVTGSGNLTLTLSGSDLYQYTTILGLGTTSWGGTTSYAGVASVTYTYTAVPEPTSCALLFVGGMAGIFILHRRRKEAVR